MNYRKYDDHKSRKIHSIEKSSQAKKKTSYKKENPGKGGCRLQWISYPG